MTKTKTRTSEDIAAEIADLEAQENQLVADHDKLVDQLAANLNGDNTQIEQQIVLIGARQQAVDKRLNMLAGELETVSRSEDFAAYEKLWKETRKHGLAVQKLNQEIAGLQAQIDSLVAQRRDLEEKHYIKVEVKQTRLHAELSNPDQRGEFAAFSAEIHNKYTKGLEDIL